MEKIGVSNVVQIVTDNVSNNVLWFASKWAKEARPIKVVEMILMPSFWNHMVFALKVSSPLVRVLLLVDGERKPPMRYIYEAMDRAKEPLPNHLRGMNKDMK
ncbi:hypothetical protein Ddye_022911 [Dipteronia dyeriana]|uniref:DUF659 domain-containing protein n=1 Tax=Dipteronia dyeriana TaxID=168575 RepID=A0AAD9WSR4_9ROSI|nr:hypothetical protein Ddye_022911 [Dipteronia dyeriana]